MSKLIVSLSPHIHADGSVESNMRGVIIALLPALLVSFLYFGIGAAVVCLTSVLSCVLFEWAICRFIMKTPRNTVRDMSAVVTGLLLAFNLPSNIPVWIVIIGALVAIGIGKMTYGGLGCNPFNPALTGRIFLLIAYPVQMTDWTTCVPDGISGSTLLANVKGGAIELSQIDYMSMLGGHMNGSMGEIGALALILGGIYLLWRRVITWHIPVAVLGTIALFSLCVAIGDGGAAMWQTPLFHLLAGGALLGAIFMATDYSTSPMTHKGMIIYGVGIGLLTMIIRLWGAYPEGMSFAIFIMNAATPLINKYCRPKRFGTKK